MTRDSPNVIHNSHARRRVAQRWNASITVGTLLLAVAPLVVRAQAVGLFEGRQDIGTVLTPGTSVYDPATGTYTLTGPPYFFTGGLGSSVAFCWPFAVEGR